MTVRMKDTETFIYRASQVHNDTYDYSKVHYVNSTTKVKILCREHGEFEMLPGNHISGKNGCSKCSGKHKYSTSEFIQMSKARFGVALDYSKTMYVNRETKVVLTCKKHGDFSVVPSAHLLARTACPNCFKWDLDSFKMHCSRLNKNKFDYSKVKFNSVDERVTIICPVHGEFEQLVYSHLGGSGCTNCSKTKAWDKERFVEYFTEKYKGLDNYDKVLYVNQHTKVTVTCNEHGDYDILPLNYKVNRCKKCRGTSR
ncbi:hypothetical protein XaC1_122 [Xanthomonas phage XaC1]|nr:hypothetical protein XaC1_122 [Xanthomonas phage XaC1]